MGETPFLQGTLQLWTSYRHKRGRYSTRSSVASRAGGLEQNFKKGMCEDNYIPKYFTCARNSYFGGEVGGTTDCAWYKSKRRDFCVIQLGKRLTCHS